MNDQPQRPTIVPDQTGTYLISFLPDDDEGGISAQWFPVLAWLIESVFDEINGTWQAMTTPITCEEYTDTAWCLWHPKHGYVVPDNCSMDTEEAAMKWARRELQKQDERRRQAFEKSQAKRAAG